MRAETTRRPTTPALVALAAFGIELVVADPARPPAISVVVAALLAAAATLARRALAARPAPAPRVALAAAVVAGLAPLVVAATRRAAAGTGPLLDVVLIEALRNLALVLIALGRDRAAALASLFLMLVASARADGPWLLGAMALYAVAGCAWLARDAGERAPLGTLAVAAVVVALTLVGPGRTILALSGLLPSSGGTDLSDPAATLGVNDGDMEVSATTDPQTIGFSESDLFLDSNRPTLYDAFNDTYGEPLRRNTTQDRMVAVAADRVLEQHRPPAENLRASREFSAVRGAPPTRSRRPDNRAADALVYHQGPTPAHLALVAYDRFNGRDWSEAPLSARACTLEPERPASPWLRVVPAGPAHLVPQGRHRVQVVRLDSSPLPLPAHTARFRLGSVHVPSFFRWAQDGILRLADRPVPPGNTIEADVQIADPQTLRRLDWADAPPLHAAALHPDVAALGRAWASGAPRGWSCVEAVVDRLRRHAAHDRTAVARPDSPDLLADFLLRDRRGPDYLFATAAVLLLRDLGYPARLVSGLYVDPARHDPATRQTPVLPDDVHVWAEVRLPDGTWTPIEPTPGYRLANPPRPWHLAIADALGRFADTLARRWPLTLSALAAGTALVRRRRAVLDAILTAQWRLDRLLRPAELPWRTLALLDRRLRWAGSPRPPGVTPRAWLDRLAATPALGPARADLDRWLALAERQFYDPRRPNPDAAASLCARVVHAATLPRLRAAASQEKPR